VFTLELILADGMGGVVFKDFNQTMLIPNPMPYNFMNKPVPERISRA
jgi:hypothetical protein